jgi:hypothetical protein
MAGKKQIRAKCFTNERRDLMGFSCTLHPVDSRVVRSLAAEIRGKRADWRDFTRLRKKKWLINRVNQPFKDAVKDLLQGNPAFYPELHLWGRPFFIYSNELEDIIEAITELYGVRSFKQIEKFYRRELCRFSEEICWTEVQFQKSRQRQESRLGLRQVLMELRTLFKNQKFERLADEIGFVLAQLLALAYPYWRLEDFSLTFLRELQVPGWEDEPAGQTRLFQDTPELAPFLPGQLIKDLAAGIYLDPAQVRELLAIVPEKADEWVLRMESKQLTHRIGYLQLQKLSEALAYAASYNQGLLEAVDLYAGQPRQYP